MSENKQPGPGKIIRTSSGSTRLTAGSAKNDTSSGSAPAPSKGADTSAKSASGSAPATEKAKVVTPPAPKASPKPNRALDRVGTVDDRHLGGIGLGGIELCRAGIVGDRQRSGHLGEGQRLEHRPGELRRCEDGREEHRRQRQGKEEEGPRTVRLTVAAVDPWSVMKMSFLMSVAIGIATIVAFIVLWVVLQATGVMSGLEATMTELAGAESAERIIGIFGFGRVVAAGFIIAVINIVLMTALSTLAAFIYNIGSLIAGGFHLTLTDD